MLNLNGTNWYIFSLGKNQIFYYVTITNDTDFIDYEFDISLIDSKQHELEQLYNLILQKPEFVGATLI